MINHLPRTRFNTSSLLLSPFSVVADFMPLFSKCAFFKRKLGPFCCCCLRYLTTQPCLTPSEWPWAIDINFTSVALFHPLEAPPRLPGSEPLGSLTHAGD